MEENPTEKSVLENKYMYFVDYVEDEKEIAREEGREIGKEEGLAEGEARGARQTTVNAAISFYNNGVPVEIISKSLGITEDEVIKITESVNKK